MNSLSLKKSLPVLLGTIVEYYDYSLYGFCPLILAAAFLPSSEPMVALVTTYGVFAIGYFSKPVGALIFGWIGDNFGRKHALKFTITGIAIPTFMIGILPSYEKIGFLASLALIGCRFCQGVFVAGEYDGAALYIMEHASIRQKALGAALVRSTGVLGLLLGSLVVGVFSHYSLPTWAWRVPFLLSLPMGLLTLYMRQAMTETPDFLSFLESKHISKKPFGVVLKEHCWEILMVILMCGAFGGTYQIAIIFLKSFLPLALPGLGLDAIWLNPMAIFFFGFSMIGGGLLAERYPIVTIIRYGLIGAFVGAVGIMSGIMVKSPLIIIISQLLLVIGLGPFNALSHALIYRFFNVNHRYRCLTASHTMGSMLFSGTAPMICSVLWHTSRINSFPLCYLLILIGLGYIMIRLSEQLRTIQLMEEERAICLAT